MSTYNAMAIAVETASFSGCRLPPGALSLPSMNPSSRTFFYRTSGGVRASTPFSAAIPAGAVVELVVVA